MAKALEFFYWSQSVGPRSQDSRRKTPRHRSTSRPSRDAPSAPTLPSFSTRSAGSAKPFIGSAEEVLDARFAAAKPQLPHEAASSAAISSTTIFSESSTS